MSQEQLTAVQLPAGSSVSHALDEHYYTKHGLDTKALLKLVSPAPPIYSTTNVKEDTWFAWYPVQCLNSNRKAWLRRVYRFTYRDGLKNYMTMRAREAFRHV